MPEPSLRPPVVMLVGATDAHFDAEVPRYRALLLEAFARFDGTLIAGGTEQGVAGLAGAIAARVPTVRVVGYVPRVLGPGASEDPRYTEIRRTPGVGFTAAEPLQAWVDVLASGITAGSVHVLGIGGGDVAGLEYRVARALGARIGVLEGSGGAVDELLGDRHWGEGVERLPESAAAVAAFIGGAPTA